MPSISTIVLASGKFDLIHPGHIFYLEESRKLAEDGELWVVITHEENIENNFFSNKERKKMLEDLDMVDKVVVGEEEVDLLGTIRKVEPDIITLGHDQDPAKLEEVIEKYKDNVTIERIEPLKPEKYSSSRYKEMLKQ